MKHRLICYGCLFLAVMAAVSCKKGRPARQEKVTTDIRIERFEQELFDADPTIIHRYIPLWEEKYEEFFSHFCHVSGIGRISDSGFNERLKAFVTDRYNYTIYQRTVEVFPDLEALKLQLDAAFSNYLFHFPGKPVPRILTFVSAFSKSAITDDNLLALGLDRYLGSNEPLYSDAGIYNYIAKNMHPMKIASDAMNFWGETEFPFNDSVNNLIASMIYKGRLLYFARNMLPGQPDSVILGFSNSELGYMEKFEKSMWAYLIEHKLLFNSDRFTINKFVLEGPFTTDFGRESPARAAVWIGYRITQDFMDRNPGLALKDLMHERDYMRILNGSGYNP